MTDCQLYLISPPAIDLPRFTAQLAEALATAQVAAFQLRLKDATEAEILAAGKALLPICQAHEVAFIVNDRPDLAKEIGADGVHLGQEDLAEWPVARARTVLGAAGVIGVSCHASRHLAMEAAEQGADYVAFGAFYPTTSKPMEKLEKWGTPTPEILEIWAETTEIPCVAIGGINATNCAPLVKAGADFLAVITAVWAHPNGPAAGVNALHGAMVGAA